jgi:hypothetical protein
MTTSATTRTTGKLNPTRQQLDELDALLQRMLELPVQPLEGPEQTNFAEGVEGPPPSTEEGERKKEGKTIAVLQPSASVAAPSGAPPLSYTVVETASPRPLPPASGFELRPPMRTSRLVPVTPPPTTPVAPPRAETNEAEMWVPLRSTWKPSASTWPPLAESWQQANSEGASLPIPMATPQHPLPQEAPEERNPAASAVGSPEVPVASSEIAPRADAADSPTPGEGKNTAAAEPLPVPATEDAAGAVPGSLLPLVWFNQGFDACLAPLGAPGRWLCGRGRIVLGCIGLACLAAAVVIAVNTGMGWSR